jgi:7 transmembrane receptor (rhodopsin family)
MLSWSNLGLMAYFVLVASIGTLGNGIILLAYGNRWNSSKSTSVIFILILACVDLWTCLIVVPTIAVMEYRDYEVTTLFCRFYSFSKILIIISSLIMSFIALDRFLNIALPHYRLLNPRRVKVSHLCCEEYSMGKSLRHEHRLRRPVTLSTED